jgi:hypothetical protein
LEYLKVRKVVRPALFSGKFEDMREQAPFLTLRFDWLITAFSFDPDFA